MKIKSVVDVITNSSTEVFTLNTKLSLDEVKNILKELLPEGGYEAPEVMKKGEGILKELEDFGYLYDPSKIEDIERYYLEVFSETERWTDDYKLEKIENADKLQEAWNTFVWNNRKRINDLFRKNYPRRKEDYIPATVPRDEVFRCICSWDIEFFPGLVSEFLKSYSGPYPDNFVLPDNLKVDHWVGKIGFSGTDDNSIDYEKFSAINGILDGINWHMG